MFIYFSPYKHELSSFSFNHLVIYIFNYLKVFMPVLLGLNSEMQKHHLASDRYKAPLQVSIRSTYSFTSIILRWLERVSGCTHADLLSSCKIAQSSQMIFLWKWSMRNLPKIKTLQKIAKTGSKTWKKYSLLSQMWPTVILIFFS